MSLSFLSDLRDLRALEFSGFSVTQPEEMLNILVHLLSLEELRIIGPPPGLRRRQRYGYQHRFMVQSFNGSVLHRMRPLKKLTIGEISVLAHDEPTFLTEDLFEALCLTHRDSLRELSVSSETSVDPAVESLMRAFLMSTTLLTKLRVGWPDMDITFLDSLSTTLRHLVVTVPGLSASQSITTHLNSLKYRLPYLRSIELAGFDGKSSH
jgi:hypothetical protein